LDGRGSVEHDVAELVEAVRRCTARLVLVSAEVGLGVVPETRSGRLFRDELGSLNASLATTCDEVQLLVASLPLCLKQPDQPTPEVGR
jgi:adenosyl cobinamide kinase/adenosyl cobinamide phosphate guanylyltransferase